MTTYTIETAPGSLSTPKSIPRSASKGDCVRITSTWSTAEYTLMSDPFEAGEGPDRKMIVGRTDAGVEKWFYVTL